MNISCVLCAKLNWDFKIQHLHISHNAPYMFTKFCITFVFHFSWVLQWFQEKLKTMLMQHCGGQIRCIMGDVQVAYEQLRQCNHREPSFLKLRPQWCSGKNSSPQLKRGGFVLICSYLGHLETIIIDIIYRSQVAFFGWLQIINRYYIGVVESRIAFTYPRRWQLWLAVYRHRLRPIRYVWIWKQGHATTVSSLIHWNTF